MQNLLIFFPIIFLFLRPSMFRLQKKNYIAALRLIDGKEHLADSRCEFYRSVELLLELRRLYGPKVNTALINLKAEIHEQRRQLKEIWSISLASYLQQALMFIMIIVMIFISTSLFQSVEIPYSSLTILQLLSVLLMISAQKLLFNYFIYPTQLRYQSLVVLKSLSQSGLSVSKVLSQINWAKMKKSHSASCKVWDTTLYEVVTKWQASGVGLEIGLKELKEEILFIKKSQWKRYKEYMGATKLVCLLISGFLSYFVYLFTLMESFLAQN
ncbi:hypothetical protein [Halobacteriovorax sp. HLS]|uniref:hypothetical protein n=1 Tax=Halobacteriovorax sp. HLS TaxID=2234000 RepID=UPI000FDCD016|nr:hypothetical protein [Halobacteriovorax sp. HLS]